MTSQTDKGINSIAYNYLDLPEEIKFSSTYIIRNKVTSEDETRNVRTNYVFRADGTKLRKEYTTFFNKGGGSERTTTTDYLDGFQYTVNHLGTVTLEFVPTSEGYYDFKNNRYIYNYTDHLGNTRLSYFKNAGGSAEVLEENNYYPFGLKHEGYNALAGNPSYQYQYNGKELQEETGWNDYGARMYMSDIARWGVMDPLAEVTAYLSPYHYGNNNPIMFNDPTGMLSQSFMDEVWGSPSGTTWKNNGNGFTNNWGGIMDSEGFAQNYRGYSPRDSFSALGASGGGVAGEIRLPNLHLGSSNAWAASASMFVHHNSFMDKWNSNQAFQEEQREFYRTCGHCNERGVMMIGGAGDPVGIFDVGGQIISNWELQNRYLAMGAGILGAIALKKAGLATKTEGNLALGLREDLFTFAKVKNFDTYKAFSTGLQEEKILNAMKTYDKIHFNVTGFSKYQFSKFKPGGPVTGNNVTNWEMHEVFSNPHILNKTQFYRKVGNDYEILPNFSPFAY